MALRLHTFLSAEEHSRLNDKAIVEGFWRDDARIIKPGTAWYTPWIFDPSDPSDADRRLSALERIKNGTFKGTFISRFYWLQWSHIRPPICVMCPNGSMWIIDQVATNGEGWQITGEGLNITASPSIVVPGYHGWLKDGEFSDDVEGRGPFGIMRVIPDRVMKETST